MTTQKVRRNCIVGCVCSDFHGLTTQGHRYPIGNMPKCEVCGVILKNCASDVCKECKGLMSETSQTILSTKPDTIEGRRIRNHASFYVQNRYKYWDFMTAANDLEYFSKSCLLKYKECGPAYVPRRD